MIVWILVAAWTATAPQAPGEPFSHALWDRLLREHVHAGHVDYEGMLRDRHLLDAYLAQVAAAEPEGWSYDARLAFYINAYNAHMVASVLDHWPVDSVLDIGKVLALIPTGRVFRVKHRIARRRLSLDDVEHGILRREFRDARIHAAVNCASRSCPPLPSWAFTAAGVQGELDRVMDAFVLDPERNQVQADPPGLSSIFRWYRDDFRAEAGSVWAYVRSRLPAEIRALTPETAEPRFLPYDWSLNR